MTTEEERLSKLQAALDALLDPGDYPGEWTLNQTAAYTQTRNTLTNRITTARQQLSTLADVERQIAPIEASTTLLNLWRKPLCDLLMACPPRDPAAVSIAASIRAVDFGVEWRSGASVIPGPLRQKMMASITPTWEQGSDPWIYIFGALKTCEKRVKELHTQRDAAQKTLDDALLDDDERAERAKTHREWQAVLNTMKLKGDPLGNGTLIAYDKKTGDPLTEFTDAQLKALRRMNETQPVSNLPAGSNAAPSVAIMEAPAEGNIGSVTTGESTA